MIKITAYYLTGSVSILSDALESTVNIVASLIGLYSLYIASLPKDENHPYGHGKAEFISSATEGALISFAGLIMMYEAIAHLLAPPEIKRLDTGIILIAFSGVVNLIVGLFSISAGKKNKSIALESGGKHLLTDTYSTIGIIIGLTLVYFTGKVWIDSATAIIFSGFVIYTGYMILRESISGIMDEADAKLIKELVAYIATIRRDNWIDLHNLRIIKYGSHLHIDCHLTLAWFHTVKEGHEEQEILDSLIKKKFGDKIELFVHIDDCKEFSCKICLNQNCTYRKYPFEKQIPLTMENMMRNEKHRIEE